jgi:hypothetical protein
VRAGVDRRAVGVWLGFTRAALGALRVRRRGT